MVSQLSKARKGFEFELAYLNSKLLALEKDLDLTCKNLTTLQKQSQELSQRLTSLAEERHLSTLNLSEAQGVLAEL